MYEVYLNPHQGGVLTDLHGEEHDSRNYAKVRQQRNRLIRVELLHSCCLSRLSCSQNSMPQTSVALPVG